MHCKKCGYRIQEGGTVCEFCGTPVDMTAQPNETAPNLIPGAIVSGNPTSAPEQAPMTEPSMASIGAPSMGSADASVPPVAPVTAAAPAAGPMMNPAQDPTQAAPAAKSGLPKPVLYGIIGGAVFILLIIIIAVVASGSSNNNNAISNTTNTVIDNKQPSEKEKTDENETKKAEDDDDDETESKKKTTTDDDDDDTTSARAKIGDDYTVSVPDDLSVSTDKYDSDLLVLTSNDADLKDYFKMTVSVEEDSDFEEMKEDRLDDEVLRAVGGIEFIIKSYQDVYDEDGLAAYRFIKAYAKVDKTHVAEFHLDLNAKDLGSKYTEGMEMDLFEKYAPSLLRSIE